MKESSLYDDTRSVRGNIKVQRGDILQTSDIEVLTLMHSDHKAAFKAVFFNQTDSSLSIDYFPQDDNECCIAFDIIVRLRPWPARTLDVLSLQSQVLDITIEGSLAWEVLNLLLHTSYGDSSFEGTRFYDPLRTHNVTTSSITGTIFGSYIADAHLNVHNSHGVTYIFLMTNIHGSIDPKAITATSDSGEIHIEYVQPYWPAQAFTHTTTIRTDSGRVYTYIPHGAKTNISTVSGRLTAVLFPFGADSEDAQSEIYTSSQMNTSSVSVSNTNQESLEGRHDPLLRTISVHQVGEGMLDIWYPYAWYGVVEGWYPNGALKFDSSSLEDLQRGQGYMKAKRGKAGESHMQARVANGDLKVSLGLS